MSRLLEQGFTYQVRRSNRILVFAGGRQVASIPTTAEGSVLRTYVAHLKQVGFHA